MVQNAAMSPLAQIWEHVCGIWVDRRRCGPGTGELFRGRSQLTSREVIVGVLNLGRSRVQGQVMCAGLCHQSASGVLLRDGQLT